TQRGEPPVQLARPLREPRDLGSDRLRLPHHVVGGGEDRTHAVPAGALVEHGERRAEPGEAAGRVLRAAAASRSACLARSTAGTTRASSEAARPSSGSSRAVNAANWPRASCI